MVRRMIATLLACSVLAGCAAGPIPRDPDGTLERVRGGILRVGVSPNPPWTTLPTRSRAATPGGTEVDLVQAYADTIGAQVQWSTGGEQPLIARLERAELDLVIGGLTAESPWTAQAALTIPYATTPGPHGADQPHVMAAPMGENAFLTDLETFLLTAAKPDR